MREFSQDKKLDILAALALFAAFALLLLVPQKYILLVSAPLSAALPGSTNPTATLPKNGRTAESGSSATSPPVPPWC